jgi:DNA polymerase phi
MSKKRKREGTEVDIDLVEVYDQLANETESIRLKAAHKLLTKVYRPDSTTEEQLKLILTRLFRGLCSGRKAARLGFAVALTELLKQVSTSTASASKATLEPAHILDILESQTSSEGNTSGQDERDHYFGRLFGAKAIIKSGVLFTPQDRTQWARLLESICSVSQKKPWLRQECGWILYQFASSTTSPTQQLFVEDVIKALSSRKLIRTPEGVAIWLAARKSYPEADSSHHVWKHKHPLARKDISSLAEIMKNARSEQVQDGHDAQGAATWSASLHFAWLVVLASLHEDSTRGSVGFEEFWNVVVDDGLFGSKSSPERKLWGIRLWTAVLAPESGARVPIPSVPSIFTRNTLHCLISALHGQDRYLRKASQNALGTLRQRSEFTAPEDWKDIIGSIIIKLIINTDFADFDKLTKTATVTILLACKHACVQSEVFQSLSQLLDSIDTEDDTKSTQHRRYLLDMESKVFSAALKGEKSLQRDTDGSLPRTILLNWLNHLYASKQFSAETRSFLQDRLAAAFEQALKAGPHGRSVVMDAMSLPVWRSSDVAPVVQFDDQISGTIESALASLSELRTRARKQAKAETDVEPNPRKPPSVIEGVILLYCAILFEVFCGDTEAVEILQDLPGDDISALASGKLDAEKEQQLCDSLIEILLSLASRSSKFLRTVTTLVFESLASKLSEEGIESLTRVLLSKENAHGQQEMFEAVNGEEDDVSEGSGDDSDELGSDVEMVNGAEDDSDGSDSSSTFEDAASESIEEDSDQHINEEQPDDELAAFDAAVASALGTRKPTSDDFSDSSDSDSNMSDTAMLALDDKLAEVFRARRDVTSRKKERKHTKENIVVFKNRVLDLAEVYLKQQSTNPLSLQFVVPLLRAIRSTQTKQLADRMCSVLRDFCSKAKGNNLPSLPSPSSSSLSTPTSTTLELLKQIHKEAAHDTSNAHSAAASQSSIFFVKVLVRADQKSITEAVDIYADTRRRQLTERECMVQPGFFTDWNNWCVSARALLAK